MSHTQDPEHTERMVRLAKGRPVTFRFNVIQQPGCGSHWRSGRESAKSFKFNQWRTNNWRICYNYVETSVVEAWKGLRMTTESK